MVIVVSRVLNMPGNLCITIPGQGTQFPLLPATAPELWFVRLFWNETVLVLSIQENEASSEMTFLYRFFHLVHSDFPLCVRTPGNRQIDRKERTGVQVFQNLMR